MLGLSPPPPWVVILYLDEMSIRVSTSTRDALTRQVEHILTHTDVISTDRLGGLTSSNFRNIDDAPTV